LLVSRRCSRDTYPESYITKYTSYEDNCFLPARNVFTTCQLVDGNSPLGPGTPLNALARTTFSAGNLAQKYGLNTFLASAVLPTQLASGPGTHLTSLARLLVQATAALLLCEFLQNRRAFHALFPSFARHPHALFPSWGLGCWVSGFGCRGCKAWPRPLSKLYKAPPNPKPQTRNPKPETRHPKPETLNSKPETRNAELETLNSKPGTRNTEVES